MKSHKQANFSILPWTATILALVRAAAIENTLIQLLNRMDI